VNIVDSSGWLEYFADGTNADHFAPVLQKTSQLLVPAITIFEVFKVVCRERGENQALQAAALMRQGTVIDLTAAIAMQSAKLSLERKMPMADSIILTTGLIHNAAIWTQDEHFSGMLGVKYFPKK
jgi:predicted nucleic acid-binding protein